MKCNGEYVANDPCYPVCSFPDGSGCDYSGVFGGGSMGGPTDNYSVTTGNAVTGNTSTRTYTSPLDPYQNINPKDLSFNGVGFDGSNRLFLDNNNGPTDLWFNQTGDNVITVGGDKYSFEPVLSWNEGCDTMDDSGDGIFPDKNCQTRPGVGGVPGLGVSALRWKNGVPITS